MMTRDARPEGSEAPAVICADGRMVALPQDILGTLGFAPDDDLSGLPFASFWPLAEREVPARALERARVGKPCQIDLDLAYAADRDQRCRIELSASGRDDVIHMKVVAPRDPASG